ncbi:acetyl-coenzyme A synthetase, cytoplasmic-like isoform X2 [Lineus longissimus]|uniref:acetyl-coenzyme A synthetase, cytoplasmic-like isoform X2 n=1 Tax=Lineus longissimus TaxID=88925 RepID=UPI00315D95F4
MAEVDGFRGNELFPPTPRLKGEAHVSSMEQYKEMYRESKEEPEVFWRKIADQFFWKSAPTGKFLEYNFNVENGPISIKWMQGAVTNICYNTLDRHVENGKGDKVAFYWEGNDPADGGKITYSELLAMTCKLANVLRSKGVKKGDRVAIYMPMIVELVAAMLACARIGAVHSIIFGGFSADSLADRMIDGKCSVLVTSDAVYRGTKLIRLKDISDKAMAACAERGNAITTCIVVRHLTPVEGLADGNGDGNNPPAKRPCLSLKIDWEAGRDVWWHDVMAEAKETCEPEWMDAEDPLFMLYTSGSTGIPKGVLHTTAGYMLYAATTMKYVFDYQPNDVYFCTADIGWITGHSYVTYGPMLNGATSVMFEGVPFYPDAGRLWEIIDKYKVSKFYTAPTAIRALMKYGEEYVKKYSRDSLKVLGTVGEPINPEAWLFYYNVIGNGNCSISDTYWQTETGGHTLTPLPGCTPEKPGSATFPFFGIVPKILHEDGTECVTDEEGYLVFCQPWPGVMRTVYGNHERYESTYFRKFPGHYCTGDRAKIDSDGYIWITGRIDDMLNCSGHLLSTAQIESALITHEAVSESAVVSCPHEVKGETTYCFVTLREGFTFNDKLKTELKEKVRTKIGPFASPDYIQEAPGLPKTRSGKIMRRVLRKVARGQHGLGDVTTMADETVVGVLFKLRPDNAPVIPEDLHHS